MGEAKSKINGKQPLPTSARGHPMPRRTSPENSVTLLHHRLARDASKKPEFADTNDLAQTRRISSDESNVTGQSDPRCWFDRSNRNAPAAFDQASMDIEPPFYQKLSDSSNEEPEPPRTSAYAFPSSAYQSTLRPPMQAHSSSADDYRSVIDDLTVENKRLKEELKRYKQFGPDPLRKDKLFEIKFHGLPHKKKRELEATLRDFASSLDGSTTSSQQRLKTSKHTGPQASSLNSKHASTSSTNSRPVDSAYASMSDPSSLSHHASMTSVGQPSLDRVKSTADHKVETYLWEIPQGLMPRNVALTDKEKKKVVVRRLEHLFTGRFGGRAKRIQQLSPSQEAQLIAGETVSLPPALSASAPAPAMTSPHDEPREARIQLNELLERASLREELSASNYNGENDTRMDIGSNGNSGLGSSPQDVDRQEQRATRPLDLDPDRAQIPSENMDYIRHLGAMAPEYLPEAKYKSQDVSMDVDGWIHLNLLCSLAQLHILNVTPDYIRSAVSERSAKFQLSRDGRKIRWRGGTQGTKFSSDSSGESSERSPTTGTDGSNEDGQRKRPRTSEAHIPAHTSAKLQAAASPGGFHYKPMFVHHQSSSAGTYLDDSESQVSYQNMDDSIKNSRSTGFASGSASSPRKKRRRDGAVVYYTGAPFCLDLSGDPDNDLNTAYTASADRAQEVDEKPAFSRTVSGSGLSFRPLVDGPEQMKEETDIDAVADPEYITDEMDGSDTEDYGFCWCDHPGRTELKPLQACLEPCGLGGVTPEDHFAVLVVTRHPIMSPHRPGTACGQAGETAESTASRLASLTVAPPRSPPKICEPHARVMCQVMQQRYKELKPLPLPPPGIFYPPFTETTDSEDDSGFEDDYEESVDDMDVVTSDDSDEASQRANPHQSDILRMSEDSTGDDDELAGGSLKSAHRVVPRVAFAPVRREPGTFSQTRSGLVGRGYVVQPDSSAATAGEASGYSSGREED